MHSVDTKKHFFEQGVKVDTPGPKKINRPLMLKKKISISLASAN